MKRVGLVLISPLLVVGAAAVAVRYLTTIVTNPDKATNIALMVDQTVNVGANGQVDTTISGRAGRAMLRGKKWGCILCKVLDMIVKNHCLNAVKSEENKSG